MTEPTYPYYENIEDFLKDRPINCPDCGLSLLLHHFSQHMPAGQWLDYCPECFWHWTEANP